MKNTDDVIRSVLGRRDEMLALRAKRKKTVLQVVPATAAAAAAVAVGVILLPKMGGGLPTEPVSDPVATPTTATATAPATTTVPEEKTTEPTTALTTAPTTEKNTTAKKTTTTAPSAQKKAVTTAKTTAPTTATTKGATTTKQPTTTTRKKTQKKAPYYDRDTFKQLLLTGYYYGESDLKSYFTDDPEYPLCEPEEDQRKLFIGNFLGQSRTLQYEKRVDAMWKYSTTDANGNSVVAFVYPYGPLDKPMITGVFYDNAHPEPFPQGSLVDLASEQAECKKLLNELPVSDTVRYYEFHPEVFISQAADGITADLQAMGFTFDTKVVSYYCDTVTREFGVCNKYGDSDVVLLAYDTAAGKNVNPSRLTDMLYKHTDTSAGMMLGYTDNFESNRVYPEQQFADIPLWFDPAYEIDPSLHELRVGIGLVGGEWHITGISWLYEREETANYTANFFTAPTFIK